MNLLNFWQSPSLATILRDLSTWSVADVNRAGGSKTVRNTYESNSNDLYFQFKQQNWNCLLNLPFLHPLGTISYNNSNTTTSVWIPLVDSRVRNNLCHPSFDLNVTYKWHNCFIFEAISCWYFDFLIDKYGDQEVIAMFTSIMSLLTSRWVKTVQGGVGGWPIVIKYLNTC